MGMDVYGIKPATVKGNYFRNNVWCWHPLWDYCEYIAPELTVKVPNAHVNAGDGLNAKDSRKLAFKIKESIENGTAQDYIQEYYNYLENVPKVTCFCLETSIEISYTADGEIPFPKSPTIPKETCRLCDGSGKMENFAKNYHINLQNISEFSEFLLNCGGFQIC